MQKKILALGLGASLMLCACKFLTKDTSKTKDAESFHNPNQDPVVDAILNWFNEPLSLGNPESPSLSTIRGSYWLKNWNEQYPCTTNPDATPCLTDFEELGKSVVFAKQGATPNESVRYEYYLSIDFLEGGTGEWQPFATKNYHLEGFAAPTLVRHFLVLAFGNKIKGFSTGETEISTSTGYFQSQRFKFYMPAPPQIANDVPIPFIGSEYGVDPYTMRAQNNAVYDSSGDVVVKVVSGTTPEKNPHEAVSKIVPDAFPETTPGSLIVFVQNNVPEVPSFARAFVTKLGFNPYVDLKSDWPQRIRDKPCVIGTLQELVSREEPNLASTLPGEITARMNAKKEVTIGRMKVTRLTQRLSTTGLFYPRLPAPPRQ